MKHVNLYFDNSGLQPSSLSIYPSNPLFHRFAVANRSKMGIDPDNWNKQPIIVQFANIGSEVIRALKWKNKNNQEYAMAANTRALELFDLSLVSTKKFSELKEIARARELWLDFFVGENIYHQKEEQWIKYFFAFNYAAQINK